jgi:hypothetical protein
MVFFYVWEDVSVNSKSTILTTIARMGPTWIFAADACGPVCRWAGERFWVFLPRKVKVGCFVLSTQA